MNKVAIVTGATGSGIGRSVAIARQRDGYHIVLTYGSNADNALAVVAEVERLGVQVITGKVDVFQQADCALLVDETLRYFHGIDVFVIGPGADWPPEPPDQIQPEAVLTDTMQEVAPVYAFLFARRLAHFDSFRHYLPSFLGG